MLEFFVESFFRGICYHMIAAITGWIYLRKVKAIPLYKKVFVYYLWGMLLVDLTGYYAALAYFSDYRLFGFLKDTLFERNYWLFNAAYPVAFLVYLWFFIVQINSRNLRNWLKIVTGIYFIGCIVFNIIKGDYFTSYVSYHFIAGSILLSICIALYFIQMLNSDQIVDFYKNLSFYVGAGALLWHLGYTPMYIFNRFNIMESSPAFLDAYKITLSIFNLFLYTFYTIGFFVEMKNFRKKQSLIGY